MTKILVIEDETMLLEEVLGILTFEGYEAIGAEDGLVGVEVARREVPDLIVCDITMPRLDGYGVLLEIQANSATIGIPFIFVTARASHEDRRRGMASGVDDYITKPFTRLELLDTIRARLERKAVWEQERLHEVEQLRSALVQEHRERLLKAKLIAMFSHDFRNPLTTILSSDTLLRDYNDRLDDERRLMHLNSIEAAVRLLLQMLDDMLIVAQMESGSLQIKPEPLTLEIFLRGIVDEFQAVHSATHNLVFESNFPNIVLADPRLLRQIAANLISNAIKYSPQDSEVDIMLQGSDQEYTLSVQDQGIGIPDADQMRLFDGFQRGSNVRDVQGTGLGLAIVKQAAEIQGGAIHIQSQVGSGTTVRVTVPWSAPGSETKTAKLM